MFCRFRTYHFGQRKCVVCGITSLVSLAEVKVVSKNKVQQEKSKQSSDGESPLRKNQIFIAINKVVER